MKIGIIGAGEMGKLYAREFAKSGHDVSVCDIPGKISSLEQELKDAGIKVSSDGNKVSGENDMIIYSVEAENIEKVVKQYAKSTRPGTIIAGQTSIKTPEIEAFDKHLPEGVNIVTCHSLHGPTISPKGKSLVVIRHRSTEKAYRKALNVFSDLGSNIIEMSDYKEHDRMLADVQAVTHLGFESMGTAWKNTGVFPWENPSYKGGIDNVKILMTLRIYDGKSHIYSGLAILNPYAKNQVKQYARSTSELFKMMIQEEEDKFRDRIKKAGDFVFGDIKKPLILDDEVMKEFNLGKVSSERKPNSHLSLLAMVDAWCQLNTNPYSNTSFQTPPYKLRLGIAEYLFRNEELLEESLNTALHDKRIRGDDLEFDRAVREWATIIENGDMSSYIGKFDGTKRFFRTRIEEGKARSDELIKRLE